MIKIGDHVAIKVEALCFLASIKDGKLEPITALNGTTEEVMNTTRKAMNSLLKREQKELDHISRNWKKFQATKEFMTEGELAYHEATWEGFDPDRDFKERTDIISGLQTALYEITDLMLEYDVPIKATDSSKDMSETPAISMDQVKNILKGLGGDLNDGLDKPE